MATVPQYVVFGPMLICLLLVFFEHYCYYATTQRFGHLAVHGSRGPVERGWQYYHDMIGRAGNGHLFCFGDMETGQVRSVFTQVLVYFMHVFLGVNVFLYPLKLGHDLANAGLLTVGLLYGVSCFVHVPNDATETTFTAPCSLTTCFAIFRLCYGCTQTKLKDLTLVAIGINLSVTFAVFVVTFLRMHCQFPSVVRCVLLAGLYHHFEALVEDMLEEGSPLFRNPPSHRGLDGLYYGNTFPLKQALHVANFCAGGLLYGGKMLWSCAGRSGAWVSRACRNVQHRTPAHAHTHPDPSAGRGRTQKLVGQQLVGVSVLDRHNYTGVVVKKIRNLYVVEFPLDKSSALFTAQAVRDMAEAFEEQQQ